MNVTLVLSTLVVRDYDEAVSYFTGMLGFRLLSDKDMGGGKRWVTVAPGDEGAALLLARASNQEQETRVGNQTGGRVSLFLKTDDFYETYSRFKERGVRFLEEPRKEEYGLVAVFEDLYGNTWDLLG